MDERMTLDDVLEQSGVMLGAGKLPTEDQLVAWREVIALHLTQSAKVVDALQDAIFQIAERLGEVRDPGMDDMSWHTQLIARAQYLANAQAVDMGDGETE